MKKFSLNDIANYKTHSHPLVRHMANLNALTPVFWLKVYEGKLPYLLTEEGRVVEATIFSKEIFWYEENKISLLRTQIEYIIRVVDSISDNKQIVRMVARRILERLD